MCEDIVAPLLLSHVRKASDVVEKSLVSMDSAISAVSEACSSVHMVCKSERRWVLENAYPPLSSGTN